MIDKLLASASVLTMALLATQAQAQSSDAAPTAPAAPVAPGTEPAPPGNAAPAASAPDSGALGEIVVTAERRTANLQQVPLAATAFTGSQLAEKSVSRLADLQYASPSLSITDQGLTQSVNIRGIGIASGSPAVANGVATYVDGIFQTPILTTGTLYDIGSVEVLRGPQGTLVGSNATGGAVFINSQSPKLNSFGGYGEVGGGNYSAFSTQGAVNVPIGTTLAIRAAGNFSRRDSFFTDIGPFHNNPDRLNEKDGRLGVLWQPGAFRATAKVEWIDRASGGFAYQPIPTTAFAAGRTNELRDVDYNAPVSGREKAFLASLELRYELNSGIVLRSVSGYNNKRVRFLYDTDGTELAKQTQNQYVGPSLQWTQEVNIISPTTGALNWIVGGYYQHNHGNVHIENRAAIPTDPTNITTFNDKRTFGAFGQAGYKVLSNVEVQLGLRYSWYKVQQTGAVVIGAGTPIFGPTGRQVANLASNHRDGRLTGKAAINWQVDPDNLIYAFVSRGYKPGGANSATSQFGPETVWDYEAGWKSAFFDNHIRTQLSAFYMKYRDFQFDAIDITSGTSGVSNVANATIKGIEAQLQAKLHGFDIDGGLAYVDSHLGSLSLVDQRGLPQIGTLGPQCAGGVASNPPICFNYAPYLGIAGGGPNLFSPKWTYNAGIDYVFELGTGMSLTPRLNYAYISSRYTNLFYSRQRDYLPGRGLLSALLTLRKGNWSLEGYANNLTNKGYVSGQFGLNEFYGAPRQFGARASIRF